MRPSLLVLIATAALTVMSSAALAKGIVDAQVCGAAGCDAVDPAFFHAVLPEGNPTGAAPVAAPFVNLRVTMHDGPGGRATTEQFTYIPSAGVMRPEGATQWIGLYPGRRAALDQLVAPFAPLPASQLTGVAQPEPAATSADDTPWWPLAGAIAATLALFAIAARYATNAMKARPRASKSTN